MTKLFSNYKRAAIDFASAQGNYLTDTTGKTYLDFSSGIGVTNLGYHPHVNQALTEQVGKILHQPNLYHNQLQEDVADLLIGDKDYLAFFCNSGAEANEAAIKIARKASGKQEIITFQNSFHGRTFGSMSATGQDKIKQGFGEGVPHFSYAIFNDIDSVKALASEETAAIMLELVQGESGVQPADQDFVKALSDFCKETGIYLIVDEVQTGIGRTGKLFAYEHYDIEPDIFTLAKGLANGVPVGAMLAKSSLGELFLTEVTALPLEEINWPWRRPRLRLKLCWLQDFWILLLKMETSYKHNCRQLYLIKRQLPLYVVWAI